MSEEHAYERLYRETIPSVVSVYTDPDGRRQRGSGSGFVYDDGHVVTNQHVVRDAGDVDLRFSEGDWRVGRVVGTDAYTDLAVVEVGGEGLPDYAAPLPVAEENPAPGTPVAALGNPMGLDGSISTGIVSGASRSMPTGNGFAIPDTVQTDAPINPGNSGGPLVTLEGDGEAPRASDTASSAERSQRKSEISASPETRSVSEDSADRSSGQSPREDGEHGEPRAEVVGVNRARGGDNIGFAVSAEVLARVVPALIAEGEYRHSYLKVRTLDVSPTVAEANGLDEPRGVLVVDVSLGPASGALIGCRGARTVRGREVPVGGDVVVAIDGEPVDSHEALMRYLLLETRPGEPVEVEILRDGERLTERLTLGERPDPRRGRDRRRDRRGGRDAPVR